MVQVHVSTYIYHRSLKSDRFLTEHEITKPVLKMSQFTFKIICSTCRGKEGATFSYLNAFIDSFIKYLASNCVPGTVLNVQSLMVIGCGFCFHKV